MGILSDIGSAIKATLGDYDKAVLIIHNESSPAPAAGEAQVTANILKAQTLSALKNNISDTLTKDKAHIILVQYNPSSIRINANAENTSFLALQENLDAKVPNQTQRSPSVVMSVDLTFDAVNLRDSFMHEKLEATPANLVTLPLNIKNSLKSKYTVLPQTQALLFTLMQDSTRNVTFMWGKMAFTGVVSEASARYTMFSVSGKPVRSVVTLNIMQSVKGKSEAKYWHKALNNLFLENNSVSAANAMDKVSNLLNVKL